MKPGLSRLYENVRQVIVGKDDVIRLAITALLARGHILIEDAPGLGKTMLARALAQSLDASFRRIQFTPDLLPADITGVSIYLQHQEKFEFIPGPIFAQVVLADEINRTTPRTQSSLLEALEERQVTVDGESRPLPEPFFLVATLNPIELSGTFPLPEAQIDRFLMRLHLGYPHPDDEIEILESQILRHPIQSLRPVLDVAELLKLQEGVKGVKVSRAIMKYIVDLANNTRRHSSVRLGISPRGSLALMRASQALSFLEEQLFVSPDTVKKVAPAVLAHRLVLEPRRESAGVSPRTIVEDVLKETPVPTMTEPKVRDGASAAQG